MPLNKENTPITLCSGFLVILGFYEYLTMYFVFYYSVQPFQFKSYDSLSDFFFYQFFSNLFGAFSNAPIATDVVEILIFHSF